MFRVVKIQMKKRSLSSKNYFREKGDSFYHKQSPSFLPSLFSLLMLKFIQEKLKNQPFRTKAGFSLLVNIFIIFLPVRIGATADSFFQPTQYFQPLIQYQLITM
jgi:hypothetical protein